MSRAWTKQPTRSDTLELLWVVVCQLYRLEHVNFLAVGAADVRTTQGSGFDFATVLWIGYRSGRNLS